VQGGVPVAPAWVNSFVEGVASVSLTVAQAATNVSLYANDQEGHFGQGNAFTVEPAGDTDADGLPDAWEMRYFQSLNAPNGAADADADGDGLSNQQEFRAGTNPTNTADVLRITAVQVNGSDVSISFTAVTAKSYQIERCECLLPEPWVAVKSVTAVADSVLTVSDPGGAGRSQFYRVRLVP